MMQRGCRKLTLAFLLTSYLLLTGCAGLSDWSRELPNDYAVTRYSERDIGFSKIDKSTEQDTDPRIDRFIVCHCNNQEYIGIQRYPLNSIFDEMDNPSPREKAFFGNDLNTLPYEYNYEKEDIEYYLIDAYADRIYGPYTSDEYEAQCESLQVGQMSEWQYTFTKE